MARPVLRVLLVDDDVRTIEALGTVMHSHGFQISLARTVRDALGLLERKTFDAVVTDVLFEGMPEGEQVLSAARVLQPAAVVMVMTGYPAVDGAVSAMKCGAVDYLQKPVEPVVLTAKIHRAVRERDVDAANLGFSELVEIVSGMVANTIERIDPYTAGHGERTRAYCDTLAEKVGLDAATRERLQLAAIAHDYGKIYLDDLGFLTKQGPLSDREYQSVKLHPELGAEKLGNHPALAEVCQYVAEHHEKWNGTGYPNRLKGEEISLPGRILGVVEVFDSLATRRSYKKAWPLEQVLEFFQGARGENFDPEVCDLFVAELEIHGQTWIDRPRAEASAAGLIGEG